MAPRPKNPPPDRRQEILDAALRVFARRGYTAATNAEIAKAAGVTAAALYYYFPSKEDLFTAVIADSRTQIMPLISSLGEQLHDQPPAVVLPMLIEQLAEFMAHERRRALISIIMAEGPRNQELAHIWKSQVFDPVASLLIRYLVRQMECGAMRRIDPRVLALFINGPLLATILTRDLMQLPLMQGLSNQELAAQLAQTLLHGLCGNPDGQ